MKRVKIPTAIDDPHMFLLWSVDEIIPLMVGVCLGIMFNRLLICCLFGYILLRFYRKFKNSKPDGYLLHLFYWLGFTTGKGVMVNPYERDWYI